VTIKLTGMGVLVLFGSLLACSTSSLLKKDITKGELLYRQKCRNCHHLVRPQKLSDEEWVSKLEDMSDKSGISAEESQLIWEYLASHN